MKKENGALTVEACLSLTIFLMVFVTILYIMRIVFAYGIVQHSLNQAAKEFSTYSYYYAVSGMADINGTIQDSTSAGIDSFNEHVGNVVNVYDKFGTLGDVAGDTKNKVSSGDLNGALSLMNKMPDSYQDAINSLGPASDTIRTILDDPKSAIKSVGSVLLSGTNESIKTLIGGEISRGLMAKYISDNGYDSANVRMKNLRIENGLDGLDFSSSKFWSSSGDNGIELVVCYTIDPIFPIKVVDKINLINRVKVRGWSGKCIFE